MKLKTMITTLGLAGFGFFFSCSSSDAGDGSDANNSVPGQAVETAFWTKFPGATGVEWTIKGYFRHADFELAGVDYETWYDRSGVWLQSEHSMAYADLPSAIRTSVSNSINYPPASWTPDPSVEVWEIPNVEAWYGVELKSGQNDVTVWYYADGNGFKEVDEDYSGDEIPGQISSFIAQQYPNSVVLNVEKYPNGRFDAIILNSKQVKTVYFTRSYTWEYTAWFFSQAQVPQAVLDALQGQAYAGYEIQQIQYRQYPLTGYYHISLEKAGSLGMTVNIDASGNVVLN